MKSLLIFISLLLLNSSSFAQSWLWGARGTRNSDAYAVAADAQGNAYLAGGFGDSITFGNYHLKSLGGDGYLVKYDSLGNIKWATQSKSSSKTSGAVNMFVATDKFGNEYVTGNFVDTVSFGSYLLLDQQPYNIWGQRSNIFLVKYDANGNVIWARQSKMPSPISDSSHASGSAYSVAADNEGNVYVTGFFVDTLIFANDTIITAPSFSTYGNPFLVKYDSSGKELWARQANVTASTNNYGFGFSVTTDKLGDAYITGGFEGHLSFGAFTLFTNTLGYSNVFLTKYDPTGNVLWARQANLPSPTCNVLNGFTGVATDGNAIYITGGFYDTIMFGPYMLNTLNTDIFLAKYDVNGNVIWAKQSYNTSNQGICGYSLMLDNSNHIYFSGGAGYVLNNSYVVFGKDTLRFIGKYNDASLIMKLDTSGKALCGSIISSGGDDNNGIATDPTGKYVYLGGDFWIDSIVFNKDTLYDTIPYTEYPFIARWLPCGSVPQSINELQANKESIRVSPNPCNGKFSVELGIDNYELGIKNTVEVYNVLGEKVFSAFVIPNSKFIIDLTSQPPGIYFIRVFDEAQNYIATTKVIVF